MDNPKRISRAEKAVAPYKKSDPHAPLQQHAVDLMTDVLHLARARGEDIDLETVMRLATMHSEAEEDGDE